MKTTSKQKKNICAICGGKLQNTTITHEEKRRETNYLFRHAPAPVCSACGEIWIEELTLREIDQLIKEGQPTRKVETPVYEFSGAR
jgi:YgiT-type zinc finger domain-containing protein